MPPVSKTEHSLENFGELTLANLTDWAVTFCLGAIFALTVTQLGGVRPETQQILMPLFVLLMILHGVFLAVAKPEVRVLHPVPLFLVPFLFWATASVIYIAPTPWRGSTELSYFFSAFLIFWVTLNNVKTRAHLWVLVFLALLPIGPAIFNGYYQFFQRPTRMVPVALDYPIALHSKYLGQATGVFADPGSFAVFLLILLPCFMIAAFVPRFPIVVRVLNFYLALILVIAITLTQVYWAAALVVILMTTVPWFCFKERYRRYLFSTIGVGSALAVFLAMYFFNPLFSRGLARAFGPEGEGIRLSLWGEAVQLFLRNPIFGGGAGGYSFAAERSQDLSLSAVPLTPHSDLLLVLGNYGLVGAALLFVPLGYLFFRSIRQWSREPFKVRRQEGSLMSTRKFFFCVGICAAFALLLSAAFHFIVYVPGLLLFAVLTLAILAKLSFTRTLKLPSFRFSGLCYLTICTLTGLLFWSKFSPVAASQGLELLGKQRLETLIERGVAVSGNSALIQEVIHLFEDALIANPGNADAWIGLSMAICQLHYSDPADFERTGERAVRAAAEAYRIAPEYWLASSQLGVSLALAGEIDAAAVALERAVGLAPNSSNAHFYYAAFLSHEPNMRERALEQVSRALEINPKNAVAQRLKQKLLIL